MESGASAHDLQEKIAGLSSAEDKYIALFLGTLAGRLPVCWMSVSVSISPVLALAILIPVILKQGGPQYRPQYTIFLIVRIPKKGTLILEGSPKGHPNFGKSPQADSGRPKRRFSGNSS